MNETKIGLKCIICGEPAMLNRDYCSSCGYTVPSTIYFLAKGFAKSWNSIDSESAVPSTQDNWREHPKVKERLKEVAAKRERELRKPITKCVIEQSGVLEPTTRDKVQEFAEAYSSTKDLKLVQHTYSLVFEFKNGEVLSMPEPGEDWEIARRGSNNWPHIYVNYVQVDFGVSRVGRGSTFYGVWHEAGRMFLHEYSKRISTEMARIVSWIRWERPCRKLKRGERYATAYPTLKEYLADGKK